MIPKTLAAKITRAQAAVKEKRQAIAYKDRERDQLREQEATLYSKLMSSEVSDHVYGLKIDSIHRKQ